MLLSIVTPAYDEAENLPRFYEALCAALRPLGCDWEWLVVDDHSRDATFASVSRLAERDPRVRGLSLARHSGSHAALTCGLHHARGDAVVGMAVDLQDPPALIPQLLGPWRDGAQVVWAVRRQQVGPSAAARGLSRLYYWMMRTVVGMKAMPATGADCFLLDRVVVDAFARFQEGNTSVLALLTWMGFRQASIAYDKQARVHGRSGWSLGRKLKLVVDSVTAFSAAPIRLMTYLGAIQALLGLAGAAYLALGTVTGARSSGTGAVLAVVLLAGGVQMVMMGVLGEYLWRALDESRRRPQYLIAAATPVAERTGDREAPR